MMLRGVLAALMLVGATFGLANAQTSIKIGVLNDQSGPLADFGGSGSVEAAKMAIEDFGGNVLGKPIEIVSADHLNKPDLAATIARKWFDADGVTAIADLTNSAVALAVQGLARERGKIALLTGPGTDRLINEDCSPTGFLWTFDTAGLARGVASAVVREGGDSWYLLVADYAFGHQMSKQLNQVVTASGGRILGQSVHPVNTSDFASQLLAAQASKAKVVGLANAGSDTTTSLKQAAEFGLIEGGQKLVGLVIVLSDVDALGLDRAQGLVTTQAFYHDLNDATRAWSQRYYERTKRMPGQIQASTYSAVLHYLRAVAAAGTADGKTVADKMRTTTVDDFYAPGAKIRADGRLMNDQYLIQVKRPAESKARWDYYKVLRTIPSAEAISPASDSKCSLMKP
ncbi:ABC transporter substrate-binding protein [Bradyrhizobium sp. AS23.2]|uniref:ABC transporter substrate-binding protein n=1 Tax=Bradyrhizobium sp. AS23.2 TaxID=1680155 RepID=UPI00093F3BFE|nr:ABC transporter permease [Bradyrhizobium sp. AS23.2]